MIDRVSQDRLYSRRFFHVFGAVVLFMTGVALQFHFGQYVAYLGFGVDTLGRVLSVSVLGTLMIRLSIGRWIDRFGGRSTWLVASVVVALSVGSVQFTRSLWLIVVLRTVATMGSAAVLTAAAVFAAQIAPPNRRAESIGTMGMAGFIGMMVGPTVGDWIFSGANDSLTPYRVFFTASAACSLAACVMMMSPAIGRGIDADRPTETRVSPARSGSISQLRVIVRHWPGPVLLVGVVFATVFCFQSLFLERLAEARGFRDIKLFFLVYCPTAMTLRLLFRRLPERFGRGRTLVGGLGLMSVGLICVSGVQSQGQLILPALLMGAGHCFIFPSMVDLAAGRLPGEFRGTGTALILGAGDLGTLIGFATMGELIANLGFSRTLKLLAVVVLVTAGAFAYLDAAKRRRGAHTERVHKKAMS